MGLDTVELVISVEDTFGIEIDDEDAGDLVNVGMLHDYVVLKLREKGESVNTDKIYGQLRAVIVDQTHVAPKEVVRSARFVQDLKLD